MIAPPHGATLLLPFTNALVPTVDLVGGRVAVELPEEIDGDSEENSIWLRPAGGPLTFSRHKK